MLVAVLGGRMLLSRGAATAEVRGQTGAWKLLRFHQRPPAVAFDPGAGGQRGGLKVLLLLLHPRGSATLLN